MHTCFLGANSRAGFFSLYDSFPPDETAFLHVIKGGPGTGKSTLLRAIAGEAEKRGLEVHRVLCSGDPDSLDGIYLPSLRLAWVDGTAPHVIEPGLFGVTGDYLNLGAFLAQSFSENEKREMRGIQMAYQELYRQAYRALAASFAAGGGNWNEGFEEQNFSLPEILQSSPRFGRLRRCFLSAITGKGLLMLEDELEGYTQLRTKPATLTLAAEEVQKAGLDAVLCPSPLDPSQPQMLLLPGEKLALRAEIAPTEEGLRLLEAAVEVLRRAKALHDELEAAYRGHMDYPAISRYTQYIIDTIVWE